MALSAKRDQITQHIIPPILIYMMNVYLSFISTISTHIFRILTKAQLPILIMAEGLPSFTLTFHYLTSTLMFQSHLPIQLLINRLLVFYIHSYNLILIHLIYVNQIKEHLVLTYTFTLQNQAQLQTEVLPLPLPTILTTPLNYVQSPTTTSSLLHLPSSLSTSSHLLYHTITLDIPRKQSTYPRVSIPYILLLYRDEFRL